MIQSKYIKAIYIFSFIAILIEIFFFNYRFWESSFFSPVSDYSVEYNNDYIEITNLDCKVHNVYVDVNSCSTNVIPFVISLSDSANTEYKLSSTEIYTEIEESKYIRIYPDGNVRKIKISVDYNYFKFKQPDIKLNDSTVKIDVTRPFHFIPIRIVLMISIMLLIYFFKPHSNIYKLELFEEKNKKKAICIIVGFLSVISLVWMFFAFAMHGYSALWYFADGHAETIYSHQADAFLSGQLHLKIKPPEYLAEMINPYDCAERIANQNTTGEYFQWDFAYLNGNYYSYFGVMPVLLAYLPYFALTGLPLDNYIVIILVGVAFICLLFRLVYLLSKKIYGKISLGDYLIISFSLVLGSSVFYCCIQPYVYSVAFIFAMTFSVLCIICWLQAYNDNTDKYSLIKLILGSLFAGFAIASRPTFGVVIFFAFIIFRSGIKNKFFFNLKNPIPTLCVIVPVLAIGSGLLYYNFLRFGSFFDFGNKYNLSTMDLANRHIALRRLPLGIFEYLFQPISISGSFPYLKSIYNYDNIRTDYMGYLFFDPVFGGVFALCPTNLFIFLVYRRKDTLKEKNIFAPVILCIILSIILLFLIIETTGITLRYQMDFALMISVSSALIILGYFNEKRSIRNYKVTENIRLFILCSIIYSVAVWFLIFMSDSNMHSLKTYSPYIYYSLKYLIFALR